MILLGLFIKLSAFSLIAFGGVNALLPTLYEIAVNQQQWIDSETFAHYFAIAQAAPGPNLMTVTLIGWHVSGVIGALVATLAICWPSSILIFWLQRWINTMRHERRKQTIQYSAAALAVGLILASAWQIALQINASWVAYGLTLSAAMVASLTRWHPLYLILIGALLGLLGWV
ncbi:MAG: chromate transporter [Polynucleobacter sp.]|nr:chromate transporter [Polynucleobacter sp.]